MRLRSTGLACVLALIALMSAVAGWPQEATKTILRSEPVVFPAYEAYRNIEYFARTAKDYEEAIGDERFVMEKLTYRSDGLEVHAYLYRPSARPPLGQKLPVVVFKPRQLHPR